MTKEVAEEKYIYVEVHAMLKIIKNILSRRNSFITLLVSTLTFFLLASFAAAGGVYGTLDRDRDLDNMFQNFEVMQDYNYFTSGGYDAPSGILLLHKDYELDNPGRLWVPIPYVDNNQVRKWVSSIGNGQVLRSGGYYAAYILDQNGNRIGVWYSETYETVKLLEGKRVFAYTPELNKNYSILSGVDG